MFGWGMILGGMGAPLFLYLAGLSIPLAIESRMRRGEKDAESAAEILNGIGGSDTLTGVFGAIGRQSNSESDADRVRADAMQRGGASIVQVRLLLKISLINLRPFTV